MVPEGAAGLPRGRLTPRHTLRGLLNPGLGFSGFVSLVRGYTCQRVPTSECRRLAGSRNTAYGRPSGCRSAQRDFGEFQRHGVQVHAEHVAVPGAVAGALQFARVVRLLDAAVCVRAACVPDTGGGAGSSSTTIGGRPARRCSGYVLDGGLPNWFDRFVQEGRGTHRRFPHGDVPDIVRGRGIREEAAQGVLRHRALPRGSRGGRGGTAARWIGAGGGRCAIPPW